MNIRLNVRKKLVVNNNILQNFLKKYQKFYF